MLAHQKNTTKENFRKLSILIAREGFSFGSFDEISGETVRFFEKKFDKTLRPEEVLQQMELAFQNSEIELKSIGKISLIYANNLYCFVPAELFDENRPSDYLKFNAKILATDFLAHDVLKNGKYVNVFVPYANINNYFFEKFGAFEYQHSASLLTEEILNMEFSSEEKTMHVQVFWKHFDMVVAKEGNLLLCNSFFFENPEDFVYYILFVAEQLKLDPEKFMVKLSGKISETSETYKLLRDYVRNCSLVNHENEPENKAFFFFNEPACE